ncbi:flavin reductase family protein [Streptomyces sp. NA02950]|uniref:flavin reductase family protein n=1 Tax=Streptomyces sp. NA02950 TaxID=2742137 RepID=UPI001590D250|nr:flavin reductase family protein [Streptomyces sp. NA02950]QKV97088.1 flavin reductase family protein [Streptomyces sp. NA02950]
MSRSVQGSSVQCGQESVAAGRLRWVAGHYPTGVVLVTGPRPAPEQPPPAMVVGTFTSVSLHPALVGFLPSQSSTTWPRIRAAGRFCVNVLGADQEQVCRSFATIDPHRWEVPHQETATGSPVLLDALVWFDCEVAGEVAAGDHWFVTGAVHDLGVQRPGPPLVFLRGDYGHFAEGSDAARSGQPARPV